MSSNSVHLKEEKNNETSIYWIPTMHQALNLSHAGDPEISTTQVLPLSLSGSLPSIGDIWKNPPVKI